MLTFPCVSVQRINHLAMQLVVFPELFALRGVLHVLHLGVQRPRRGKQKLQCVSMWYNVSSCTLKSIETHYILRFGDIMIDGPFGGPAVPGLEVPDVALELSVSATPNVRLKLTLKFTCSILRHIEIRNKQHNQPSYLKNRRGRW